MRIEVSKEILLDQENKHWDMLREFRLSGDVLLLKGFVQDAAAAALTLQDTDALKSFKDAMTSREYLALAAIIEEIYQEGNISVVKMVQKAGVSRPVFDNLLAKLKNHNIAEVANQGVKGTHIKFLYATEDILYDK